MAIDDKFKYSLMDAPIAMGVVRRNGKPLDNPHPWLLRADELRRRIGTKDRKKELLEYFEFLKTKPPELDDPDKWFSPDPPDDVPF